LFERNDQDSSFQGGVKFVQSGLLEKTVGNGFDHQKRPLKEGEFLTIRNKWYNQDVNR
jgi:hypothetical protein